jgi:hypothetical protein
MHSLSEYFPKAGKLVQLRVYKDSSKTEHVTYVGSVQYSRKNKLVLGGLVPDTCPLKGCDASGRFVPLVKNEVTFPKPKVPLQHHVWKSIRNTPTSEGQYFVFLNNDPIPLTIVSSKQFVPQNKTCTFMCLIGGTHCFLTTSIEDLANNLYTEGLVPFREYKDTIYEDMLALLKGTMQRKILEALKNGLRLTL